MSFLLHDPLLRPLSDLGLTLPGAYMLWFESGTTTPTEVYADAALGTPLSQTPGDVQPSCTASAAGQFPAMYGNSAVVYRRQIYTALGVLLPGGDVDPIHPTVQFPAGTIAMFRGDAAARDAAYPPALWALCDGDDGTIDMRGRVPIGADGSTYVAGEDGGTSPGGVTTTSGGAHDHGAVTGSHVLITSELPAHRHLVFASAIASATLTGSNQAGYASNTGGDTEYSMNGTATDATGGRTSATGSDGGHTHPIASGGAHTHDVTLQLPPWGAFWMLERKP